jgi:hypothetical protein
MTLRRLIKRKDKNKDKDRNRYMHASNKLMRTTSHETVIYHKHGINVSQYFNRQFQVKISNIVFIFPFYEHNGKQKRGKCLTMGLIYG